MPELPEVETIRRGLAKFIIKQKITSVEVLCEKSFLGSENCGKIKGALITKIRRFGKALIIDLDNNKSLMIHLRMTGQLIYDPREHQAERFAAGHPSDNFLAQLPNKQTRVIFKLDSGTLYFNDQRKFGFIKVLDTSAVKDDPFIKKLAPEPWDTSPEDFCTRVKKHPKSPIKAVLLDQTVVAGLGNIYADETLFAARIHPATPVASLTESQLKVILAMACRVMDFAIASGGSTIKDYKKPDGSKGNYLDKFARVYGRAGQPCTCGAIIAKTRVAGRGTHFCPKCQRLKETAND